uniref:Uncharacterized protein n=1 Tax=Chromera velia CCMP2878 TaxID=1169474 RepID=A0A0G4F6H0_9ALVE|eukprot:Cvel_15322.t1-p1 / transcript=Cvel_15322.t1 / gene=Cvel_15322 / organism=Chromera_velia_CCMP2878 / gene_product=hypothetical protein / transcript_product=hypothetical protein / location=Cvel_scaffold1127:12616-17425(+) / protein_length=1191 / sequence_SO=supercontig / SO=protein_coding / is_pseudo=false
MAHPNPQAQTRLSPPSGVTRPLLKQQGDGSAGSRANQLVEGSASPLPQEGGAAAEGSPSQQKPKDFELKAIGPKGDHSGLKDAAGVRREFPYCAERKLDRLIDLRKLNATLVEKGMEDRVLMDLRFEPFLFWAPSYDFFEEKKQEEELARLRETVSIEEEGDEGVEGGGAASAGASVRRSFPFRDRMRDVNEDDDSDDDSDSELSELHGREETGFGGGLGGGPPSPSPGGSPSNRLGQPLQTLSPDLHSTGGLMMLGPGDDIGMVGIDDFRDPGSFPERSREFEGGEGWEDGLGGFGGGGGKGYAMGGKGGGKGFALGGGKGGGKGFALGGGKGFAIGGGKGFAGGGKGLGKAGGKGGKMGIFMGQGGAGSDDDERPWKRGRIEEDEIPGSERLSSLAWVISPTGKVIAQRNRIPEGLDLERLEDTASLLKDTKEAWRHMSPLVEESFFLEGINPGTEDIKPMKEHMREDHKGRTRILVLPPPPVKGPKAKSPSPPPAPHEADEAVKTITELRRENINRSIATQQALQDTEGTSPIESAAPPIGGTLPHMRVGPQPFSAATHSDGAQPKRKPRKKDPKPKDPNGKPRGGAGGEKGGGSKRGGAGGGKAKSKQQPKAPPGPPPPPAQPQHPLPFLNFHPSSLAGMPDITAFMPMYPPSSPTRSLPLNLYAPGPAPGQPSQLQPAPVPFSSNTSSSPPHISSIFGATPSPNMLTQFSGVPQLAAAPTAGGGRPMLPPGPGEGTTLMAGGSPVSLETSPSAAAGGPPTSLPPQMTPQDVQNILSRAFQMQQQEQQQQQAAAVAAASRGGGGQGQGQSSGSGRQSTGGKGGGRGGLSHHQGKGPTLTNSGGGMRPPPLLPSMHPTGPVQQPPKRPQGFHAIPNHNLNPPSSGISSAPNAPAGPVGPQISLRPTDFGLKAPPSTAPRPRPGPVAKTNNRGRSAKPKTSPPQGPPPAPPNAGGQFPAATQSLQQREKAPSPLNPQRPRPHGPPNPSPIPMSGLGTHSSGAAPQRPPAPSPSPGAPAVGSVMGSTLTPAAFGVRTSARGPPPAPSPAPSSSLLNAPFPPASQQPKIPQGGPAASAAFAQRPPAQGQSNWVARPGSSVDQRPPSQPPPAGGPGPMQAPRPPQQNPRGSFGRGPGTLPFSAPPSGGAKGPPQRPSHLPAQQPKQQQQRPKGGFQPEQGPQQGGGTNGGGS